MVEKKPTPMEYKNKAGTVYHFFQMVRKNKKGETVPFRTFAAEGTTWKSKDGKTVLEPISTPPMGRNGKPMVLYEVKTGIPVFRQDLTAAERKEYEAAKAARRAERKAKNEARRNSKHERRAELRKRIRAMKKLRRERIAKTTARFNKRIKRLQMRLAGKHLPREAESAEASVATTTEQK